MRNCRFNFHCEPFGVTPDPKFLFPSRTHRDAMTALSYLIEHRRGFMVLLGGPGMGKTTLLYQMLQMYQNSAKTSFVFQTQSTPNELLLHIAADFGIDTSGTAVDLQCRLRDLFIRTHQNRKNVLVVVDEAQNLSADVLETVRLLSNYETTETKLLQIVLAGQEQLAARLHAPELTQLLQRVAMTRRLLPLMPEETSAFIMHRLRIAGAPEDTFSEAAIAEIAARSLGIPRKINRLCFNSLALAEAASQDTVQAEVVVRADSVDDAEMLELVHRPATPACVVSSTTVTGKWATASAPAQPALAPSSISAVPNAAPADKNEQAPTPTRRPEVASKRIVRGPKKSLSPKAANSVMNPVEDSSGSRAAPAESHSIPHGGLGIGSSIGDAAGQLRPEDKFLYEWRSAKARSIMALQRKNHEGSSRSLNWGLVGAAAVVLTVVSAGVWLYAGKGGTAAPHAPVLNSSSAATANENRNSLEHPSAIGALQRSASTPSMSSQKGGRLADGERGASKAAGDASAKAVTISVSPGSLARASVADGAQEPDTTPPSLGAIGTDRQFPSAIVKYDSTAPKLASSPIRVAPAPAEATSLNNWSSTSAQIRKDAVLISRVDPVYPPVAKRLNLGGTAVLRVDIAEDGKVAAVHALNGPAVLAAAAVEAVRQWRYEPALVDGKAQKSTSTVTVRFTVK
jgi:TonB family protein